MNLTLIPTLLEANRGEEGLGLGSGFGLRVKLGLGFGRGLGLQQMISNSNRFIV